MSSVPGYKLKQVKLFLTPETAAHALPRLVFFLTPSFTRRKIDGIFFNVLQNGFALYLSLESSQCLFNGFAFLYYNISHNLHLLL
jgi:hypothetical protein